jgi:hypothetical protein
MFLLGCATLAATQARAPGQSRTSLTRSVATLPQTNSLGALSRSSFLTAGFGANPLAALSAYGGLRSSTTQYGTGAALGTSAYGNGANLYSSGYGTSPYSSGYGTPSSGYSVDPSAEEVKAQGQLLVNQQQAYYIREKVRAEKIDNRRKAFDEYLYEREKTPTAEDERRLLETQLVRRARNNPPVSEIWSGQALNVLLKDLDRPIGQKESVNFRAQPIALDQDGLKHINVTRATGNIALLKNNGHLLWPVGLSGSEYQTEREQLTELAQTALKQVESSGQVSVEIIRQMSGATDRMRLQLRKEAETLSASLYIEAKGFLVSIDSAVIALRQADVHNQFTGQYALPAGTVSDLVKFMAEQRLQFAPALPEDRTAYEVLHRALAGYGQPAMMQTTSR